MYISPYEMGRLVAKRGDPLPTPSELRRDCGLTPVQQVSFTLGYWSASPVIVFTEEDAEVVE